MLGFNSSFKYFITDHLCFPHYLVLCFIKLRSWSAPQGKTNPGTAGCSEVPFRNTNQATESLSGSERFADDRKMAEIFQADIVAHRCFLSKSTLLMFSCTEPLPVPIIGGNGEQHERTLCNQAMGT